MQKFTKHTGLAVPLFQANIDTDQIIPKQFLKSIKRTGFGVSLFYDWRYLNDETPNSEFVLNEPRHKDASILIAGKNFGCGSSREHAPWALMQYGFHAIIAPSFADIFYNNSLKNGLVPVVLPEEKVAELVARAREIENYQITVDLENQLVTDGHGLSESFSINEFSRHCLLKGLDDIALTLEYEPEIAAYEKNAVA